MLSVEKRKARIQVKLVGNTLIAAFGVGEPPLVWHFDTEQNHSFTVTLQRLEGDWDLVVTQNNETQAIAHFDNYDTAEAALMAVQKALMSKTPLQKNKKHGFLGMFALLVAIAALIFAIAPSPTSVMETGVQKPIAGNASSPATNNKAPEAPAGVPVPADEALKRTAE
ncbi:MAG: hypothetical protein PHX43_07835 [Alphaproteobacteria bacterium]|nr:hypothetical protein [Alphaproteobacteria bacterium]